jgi:adenylosuccinate lyase
LKTLGNAVLRHLAEKLPISRWQRDLTDSTVLRNLGVGLGYSLLGYDSCVRGLDKLEADPVRIHADLSQAWEVLAEPIQTMMRKYCLDNPYDRLKALTRGKAVDETMLKEFVATLPIPEFERERLANMRPENYIGLAAILAKRIA